MGGEIESEREGGERGERVGKIQAGERGGRERGWRGGGESAGGREKESVC